MIQKIDAPISVILKHDHLKRTTLPVKIKWENKDYFINKIGYHHKYHSGRVLVHVYSVITNTLFFRLELNTDNLLWRVTEIADNETN
jgi:hypothetical protein